MFRATLKLPPDIQELDTVIFCGALSDLACASSALRENNALDAPWVLEFLFREKPDGGVMNARIKIAAEIHGIIFPDDAAFKIEAIKDRDWLSYSYKQFPAFSVGPFFIYGSHYDGDVPGDHMGLQIDAATAFGSGEHGTTKGCLQAMVELKEQGACPWNVLDMGTGSGILAIAAWKLWKTPVLAVDNDPECIRVSERHQKFNGVPLGQTNMRTLVNEGFAGDAVAAQGPFDLIIANILPGPLKDIAKDLASAADENGYVVLSGILNEQVQSILDVYVGHGLAHRKTYQNGDWSSLLLQNAAA